MALGRLSIMIAVVGVAAGAGCLGERAQSETFDGDTLPSGWAEHNGSWNIVNASAASRVLSGRGVADPGLSSLVNDGFGSVSSFELHVDVGLLSGADPQGAGIVFSWRDAGNYTIIRYSTHEHGWHLFTVIDGARTKVPNATLPGGTDPGFNEWMDLTVSLQDNVVTAQDGATRVIEHRLGHDAQGRVGLFVRGNSRAYFDNFSIAGR